jgi:hypothetical protein
MLVHTTSATKYNCDTITANLISYRTKMEISEVLMVLNVKVTVFGV